VESDPTKSKPAAPAAKNKEELAMNKKPMSYNDLMRFRYSDVTKRGYAQYFRQEPDGSLTEVSRKECFDFSDNSRRIRFFADPESGLCIRLAPVIGDALETACFAAQSNFSKRLADGREPKDVLSTEDCHGENGGRFNYDVPDTSADLTEEAEGTAFEEWLESKLTADEFGLLRAIKDGSTVSEYAKSMESRYPDMTRNSIWRKYTRLMDTFKLKVKKLYAEWNGQ